MSSVLNFTLKAWQPCLEILLFWWAYFVLLKFLKRSGALQVLKGLFFVFIAFVAVEALGLTTISRLMNEILPISVIAFLVVFQAELRRGLSRIGQSPMFKLFIKEEKFVDEIVKAIAAFSKKRIGALIAIEREIGLKQYSESGVEVDALVTFELLSTIFNPASPLHDGGIVLRGTRLDSAGCLFPLTQSARVSKTLGTRHRAAIGLTEEADAIAIVVSEESGAISLAEKGELKRGISTDELRELLIGLYTPKKSITKKNWMPPIIRDKSNESTS